MAIERKKVGIIGTGNVGATLAFYLVTEHLCDDLVLIDRNEKKAVAEMLDLQHSMGYSGNNIGVTTGTYADCGDLDLIVLAISAPYTPGMVRMDMAGSAVKIVKEMVPEIMKTGFDGIFVVITNPVDVVSYWVQKLSGLPDSRVIGTGTSLDSARLRLYLATVMGVDPRSVEGFCMGEHGDSQFIPWSQVSVGSKKFTDILKDNPERLKGINLEEANRYTSQIAYQIMEVKGATTYGIAAVTGQIVRAIMEDENKVFPVSTMFHGEYGMEDVYMGCPAVLTSRGVKELVEYHLTDEEQKSLEKSGNFIRSMNASVKEKLGL